MPLHQTKRRAIINWFNSLTCSDYPPGNSLADFAEAEQLIKIATYISANPIDSVNSPEEAFDVLKVFINDFFRVESEVIIDFSNCIKEDELEIAKVLVFLLSAMVQKLLADDETALNALTNLENDIQLDIEECMSFVLSFNSYVHSRDDFDKILSQAKNKVNTRVTGNQSSAYKTPKRTPKRSARKASSSSVKRVSRATKNTPIAVCSPHTPIKNLLESPLMIQQVSNRNKDREILKLRGQLHVEENKTVDLTNENESLKKDLEKKGEKIKTLKEKLDECRQSEDAVNESKGVKELYEKKLQEVTCMNQKLEDYKNLKDLYDLLKAENEEMFNTKETLEKKLASHDDLRACHEELQLELESLKRKSEEEVRSLEAEIEKNKHLELAVQELQDQTSAYKQMYEDASEHLKKFQNSPDVPEGESMQIVLADDQLQKLQQVLREKEAIIESLQRKASNVEYEMQTLDITCVEQEMQTVDINCSEQGMQTSDTNFAEQEIQTLNTSFKPECIEQGTQTADILVTPSQASAQQNSIEQGEASTSKHHTLMIHYKGDSNSSKMKNINIGATRRKIRHTPYSSSKCLINVVHTPDGEKSTKNSNIKKRIEFVPESDELTLNKENDFEDADGSENRSQDSLSNLFSIVEEQFQNMNSMNENSSNDPMLGIVNTMLSTTRNFINLFERMRNFYENFYDISKTVTKGEIVACMRTGLIDMEDEGKKFLNYLKELLKNLQFMLYPPKSESQSTEAENQEIVELKCLVKELIEKDNDNRQKLSDVTSSVVELQVKCVELEQKYADEMTKNKVAISCQMVSESEINNFQCEIQALQSENRTLKASCQKKQSALEDFIKDMQKVDDTVVEERKKWELQIKLLKQDKEKFKLKYESAKKLVEKYKQELSEKEDHLNKYSAQLKSYQNKLVMKKNYVKELGDALEKEKNNVKSVNSSMDVLKSSIRPLHQKIHNLELDLKKKKDEIDNLFSKLQEANVKLKRDEEEEKKKRLTLAVHRTIANSIGQNAYRECFGNNKEGIDIEANHVRNRFSTNFNGNQLSVATTIHLDNGRNTSFDSIKSTGLNNKSFLAGSGFKTDDEEDIFNYRGIADLGDDAPPPESASKRINELRRRNTLCPPHMRSAYPVELQELSPTRISNNSLMKSFETKDDSKLSLAGQHNSKPLPKNKREGMFTPRKFTKKAKTSTTGSSSQSNDSITSNTWRHSIRSFSTPMSVKKLLRLKASKARAEEEKKRSGEEKTKEHIFYF